MYTFLLVLLLIDSLILVAAVLLQAGKGGGLSANFGGSGTDMFIGTRQAGNLLTKASWWCGGIFIGLAFVLSIASTRRTVPRSVIEQGLPSATSPAGPSPAPSGTPAVPLEPATPQPTPPAGQTPPPTTTPPPSR